MEAAMKLPGPDHPITIKPATERVRVTFNGKVVADSKRALVLQEAAYKPVFYIPREDAQMALTERTSNSTHCPYKGDASYYTIKVGERDLELRDAVPGDEGNRGAPRVLSQSRRQD
jgi:uncharacterized protein (DUF427 family)